MGREEVLLKQRKEYLLKLGEKIEELRKQNGYSQTAFSKLIGISRMQLHRIEKGEADLGANGLRLISIALEVKISDLADITD